MGMAASQVRLLSLTVRQHTIENRAQYLQAQKLRLSNESDHIYEKYINALDATSLETKTYDSEGKVKWIDGSFNNLTKYTHDSKANGNVYYVQDINDGLLYQPLKVYNAYNDAGGDIYAFLTSMGVGYLKDVHTDEYINAEQQVKQDELNGWNVLPFSDEFREKYVQLNALVENPPNTDIYEDAYKVAIIASGCKNSNTSGVYLSTDNTQLTQLKNYLNELKTTPYYTGEVKTIIDYCNSFNISDIFNNTNNVNKLIAHTTDGKTYISYDKPTEEAKDGDNKKVIDDQYKLSLLLNGGNYKVNDGATIDIYEATIQDTMNAYTGGENANIGDSLLAIAQNIQDAEREKSRATAETNLVNYVATSGMTIAEIEKALDNYQTYKDHVTIFNAQSKETYTKYDDPELGLYYERMFNAILAAGGCKPISEDNAKSATWVNNMIKNAQVVLGVYDEQNKDIDNITASSNTGLREISNDDAIAKADSEYEANLSDINSKETKYQTELNQLEEERNAIQTEIESLKKIAKENIESTFKTFT